MKKTKKNEKEAPVIDGIDRVLRERLYPYQQAWMADQSRFKMGLWARQTGKDFTCAAEAVVDCLRYPGSQWLIIACAERQAMETLQKVRDWADTFGCKAEGNLTQMRFENGSRIVALPARPASIRGYSANLILTEFAFHEDPVAVWRAAYPVITSPGGGREKKVRIISTPNGQSNLFHRLWSSATVYSKHFVSIHQAIAQGLPLDAAELQCGLGDPEAWQQEYECQFIDTSAVLLPYDLLRACQSPAATHQIDPYCLTTLAGKIFCGVALEPTGKRAVCWTLEAVPPSAVRTEELLSAALAPEAAERGVPRNYLVTREILLLEGLSIPAQVEAIARRARPARRTWADASGAGGAAGRLLARRLGISLDINPASPARMRHPQRFELEPFTPALQGELFPQLQAMLQSGRVLLPEHPTLLDELHSMQGTVLDNRQVVYRPGQNSCPEYAAALALAVQSAVAEDGISCGATTVEIPRFRS